MAKVVGSTHHPLRRARPAFGVAVSWRRARAWPWRRSWVRAPSSAPEGHAPLRRGVRVFGGVGRRPAALVILGWMRAALAAVGAAALLLAACGDGGGDGTLPTLPSAPASSTEAAATTDAGRRRTPARPSCDHRRGRHDGGAAGRDRDRERDDHRGRDDGGAAGRDGDRHRDDHRACDDGAAAGDRDRDDHRDHAGDGSRRREAARGRGPCDARRPADRSRLQGLLPARRAQPLLRRPGPQAASGRVGYRAAVRRQPQPQPGGVAGVELPGRGHRLAGAGSGRRRVRGGLLRQGDRTRRDARRQVPRRHAARLPDRGRRDERLPRRVQAAGHHA